MMPFGKGSYGSMAELHKTIFEEIRKHPHGVSRRALQKRLGISDPSLEESRKNVWRLSSALAHLQRHEHVVSDVVLEGELHYYPRAS